MSDVGEEIYTPYAEPEGSPVTGYRQNRREPGRLGQGDRPKSRQEPICDGRNDVGNDHGTVSMKSTISNSTILTAVKRSPSQT